MFLCRQIAKSRYAAIGWLAVTQSDPLIRCCRSDVQIIAPVVLGDTNAFMPLYVS